MKSLREIWLRARGLFNEIIDISKPKDNLSNYYFNKQLSLPTKKQLKSTFKLDELVEILSEASDIKEQYRILEAARLYADELTMKTLDLIENYIEEFESGSNKNSGVGNPEIIGGRYPKYVKEDIVDTAIKLLIEDFDKYSPVNDGAKVSKSLVDGILEDFADRGVEYSDISRSTVYRRLRENMLFIYIKTRLW